MNIFDFTAANVAMNKRDGMFKGITVFELKEKLDRGDDIIVLDVRSEDEFKRSHISSEKVVNIPLLELRERLSEIPRDKEIVTVCALGLRSYETARILKGAGFEKVKVLEGGMAFWFE